MLHKFVLLSLFALPLSLAAQAIRITADLTDAPRKLYHAEIDLPVAAGPLTLTTPQWIPGNHRPSGPVSDITGVVFTADGPDGTVKPIPWRRDDVDMYQFHLTVPAGVTTLHAHLDCIVIARATTKMAVLEWEKLLLYPANKSVNEIAIQPSVKVLEGWGIGTALVPVEGYDPQHPKGGIAHYATTTVEQLEDSPIITGQYFHEFALAPEIKPAHFLDVVSDSPEDSQLRPETLAEVANLVREANAAYQSHHYNQYHFLLTLSDVAGGEGLEHGQSSDNGVGELGFADDAHQLDNSDLLAHEFTHSWNGKYRRPARLYQTDFSKPEQTDLLWVYEGLTQYLGNVLAARSGLKSQEQYRDILALAAASLDYKPGRQWRSLEDTAIAASVLRSNNAAWSNWRRSQDYYSEGELLWLDADTLIRKLTKNKKSLTDFERIFLGQGGNTGPLILPYERAEVVADLNQVVPYDWATFLHDRIDNISPHVNLAGIEQGGWKLVYADKPSRSSRMLATANPARGDSDTWYSLGLRISAQGVISDVRVGGPGDKARLTPGQRIFALNGEIFTRALLHQAIREAKGKTEAIHLILQQDTFVTLADLDYHDGERYPQLVRIDKTPDYLDDITAPLTKPEKAPAAKPDTN